jgi:hypothetical protein
MSDDLLTCRLSRRVDGDECTKKKNVFSIFVGGHPFTTTFSPVEISSCFAVAWNEMARGWISVDFGGVEEQFIPQCDKFVATLRVIVWFLTVLPSRLNSENKFRFSFIFGDKTLLSRLFFFFFLLPQALFIFVKPLVILDV